MVRELLKSNKELREQMESSSKEIEHKNLEIYELTRENEMLRERAESTDTLGFQQPSKEFNQTDDLRMDDSERPRSNFKPRSTVGQTASNFHNLASNVISGGKTNLSRSRGNFNNWNSV
jgi:hypothetical protein